MTARDIKQQATYFSLRADEMRVAAASMTDMECCEILLQLANAYENQAEFLNSRLGPVPAIVH